MVEIRVRYENAYVLKPSLERSARYVVNNSAARFSDISVGNWCINAFQSEFWAAYRG